MFNRRKFMGTVSTGAIATLFPLSSLNAATPKRVIVVGGGMAGATAAKFLRLWSNKTLDVTLVVPSTTYISNIMSNLTVTGQVPYSSLQFNYSKLTANYGVKLVTGTVTEVSGYGNDTTGTVKVLASNGSTSTLLSSERLILAPGIKMDQIPLATGGSTEVLHAWQAGSQTTALQSLLTGMTAGGTFVLTIPQSPYRCPPGPYERACVVADYLKRKKPGSKIIVCDENTSIQAEKENFNNAFRNYATAGVLEYWPAAKIQSVTTGTAFGKDQTLNIQFLVDTNNNYQGTADYIGSNVPFKADEMTRSIKGSVMNIIPPHRAADIVFKVPGLIPSGETFAPVNVISFESLYLDKVHVIGDASNTSLPKAGHVANQEAKICAAAIIASLNNQTIEPMPTANSACFSPINNTQASWLTAIYQYKTKDSRGADLPPNKRFVVWDGVQNTYGASIEASAPSTGNFSKMNTWFKVLMSDSFA